MDVVDGDTDDKGELDIRHFCAYTKVKTKVIAAWFMCDLYNMILKVELLQCYGSC